VLLAPLRNSLSFALELDFAQQQWLEANCEQKNDLYQFLNAHLDEEGEWREDAKDFAREALDEWMDGGEVDIENEIIKDSSFIGTKADCILEVLLNQTGYFRDVMNAFTNANSEYRIRFTTSEVVDGADAQTSEPDENNIITITFRPTSANGKDLEVAGILLHEGVHAQLHRVLASGNNVEYNMSTSEYNWLIELNEWWSDKSSMPEQTAQHDFMAVRYVNPIANAVQKFDSYTYSLENYMYFGWEGLFDEANNRGLITMNEFNNLLNLAQTPLNDNHNTSCE